MSEKAIAEVGDSINKLISIMPKEVEKFMKAEARSARKYIRDYAKTKVKKITGNYLKGFKAGKKVYKWSDAEYNVQVHNTMPHAHLLENGHRIIVAGRTVGFVPGKHIMSEACKRYEIKFQTHIEEELVDFIAKELEKW